jgi:hypothetical protein
MTLLTGTVVCDLNPFMGFGVFLDLPCGNWFELAILFNHTSISPARSLLSNCVCVHCELREKLLILPRGKAGIVRPAVSGSRWESIRDANGRATLARDIFVYYLACKSQSIARGNVEKKLGWKVVRAISAKGLKCWRSFSVRSAGSSDWGNICQDR